MKKVIELVQKSKLEQAYTTLDMDWLEVSLSLRSASTQEKEILAWLCQIRCDYSKAKLIFESIPHELRSCDLILNQASCLFNLNRYSEGLSLLAGEFPHYCVKGWQFFHNILTAQYKLGLWSDFSDTFLLFQEASLTWSDSELSNSIPVVKLCDKVSPKLASQAWEKLFSRKSPVLNPAIVLRDLNYGNFARAMTVLTQGPLTEADSYHLRGLLAHRLGRPEEALKLIEKIPAAHINSLTLLTKAQAERESGDFENAKRTLSMVSLSENKKAMALLATILIYQGNLKEGFALQADSLSDEELLNQYKLPFDAVRWDGVGSETLVILGDQGLGDQLIYGSCVDDLLAEYAGRVYLLLDRRLIGLFRRTYEDLAEVKESFADASVNSDGKLVYERLSRLTARYRGDFKNFLKRGYRIRPLISDPLELNTPNKTRSKCIGISWKTTRNINAAKRNANLPDWLKIAENLHVNVVNLQYGTSDAEWAQLRHSSVFVEHRIDLQADLEGVAGLMKSCDVIVSIGNTNAYLAGALGLRTIVVLPTAPREVWFEGYYDSPWFKSVSVLLSPTAEALEKEVEKALLGT
jgi:hypothetical protein